MIVDLDTLDSAPDWECDVCIVGSGAAGLAVAREFLDSRYHVVVLEAGGERPEPATQDLYRTGIEGLPFAGAEAGRFRIFGGSTTQWGGQALPLFPIDFEPRDWVAHSGWPIAYQELAPYYRRACHFLNVDSWGFGPELAQRLGANPPRFDESRVRYHFSKWSPNPDLGGVYRDTLRRAPKIRLLLHANVGEIVLADGGGAVRSVRFRSLAGRSGQVRPRYVILCCGGIENARILLASRLQERCGVGNGNGLVGRFFQDHPAAQIGMLRSERPDQVQRAFNLFYRGGRKYSVRISAAPELQRRERILNVTSAVNFDVPSDSAYEALREVYRSVRARQFGTRLWGNAARCVANAGDIARPLFEYYVRRRAYSAGASFRVMINLEQEPDPESRIALGAHPDALGMPIATVHWRVSELARRTAVVFSRTLREQLRGAGLGELELAPWVEHDSPDWDKNIADQFHHIGTTRMHDDPKGGVVDSDCRVHSVDNLFIGSSSVFPTGGHSNPTLTLIALSIRIADRVKGQLA
jgi:choline dehydrogenase-like flavoprotein